QQVFVTVYESLNQYNPDYKFFSWLYRIAVNRALLSVRQKKQFLPIDQYRLNAGDEEDRPKAKEMRDALLNQSIGKLKEKYRTVIVLKYYAGMPYADIAETLEITEKKVRSRLFDARKQLKDELIRIHFFTQWND
ncbi:MAG TPA: sigma-70 family RNA polymerase sigma factor, partial [Prolixibacteraceae bacterium]|nr:sigma-70 family RNA polymerase sigma factor [Prolixibacteraceae bacterium]